MRELLSTTDPVVLSFALSMLEQAGIEAVVFDQHMSIMEGSIGILPRRVMVADEDHARAVRVLEQSGQPVPLTRPEG